MEKQASTFAPGVKILSSVPNNKYASFQGTSMAAPHVSGAYALLLSANPTERCPGKSALINSTDPDRRTNVLPVEL